MSEQTGTADSLQWVVVENPYEQQHQLFRWASPSFLLLVLLLFPLPWVEWRCEKTGPQGKVLDSSVILTQSGLQAVFGSGTSVKHNDAQSAPEQNNPFDSLPWSPEMAAFVCAVLVGLLAGFGWEVGTHRLVVVGLSALTALAIFVVQLGLGFPIERWCREETRTDAERRGVNLEELKAQEDQADPDRGMFMTDKFGDRTPVKYGTTFRYTVWMWLAFANVLLANGLIAAEALWMLRASRHRVEFIQAAQGPEATTT